ncbi:hypothetical protein W03_13580 [Nitrosomonas sp. PY1]|uniref:hypothetical protein n=1 Tax=Nitrosomonas sp. PY1 TaxID=1803906 RepID=UPI001FC80EB2|nr:hypothetical protein [Nitrosomonas sp. PY1]GKS69354.1 hypothetical protein W03_13580 [Nitrosomonas sp. PY1]
MKVIAVSIPGSSYSEPVEYRLRYRYAVASALGSSEYTPQDNEHIRYFHLDTEPEPSPSCGVCSVNGVDAKITLPYEWYESSSQSEKVLVIWLNEDRIPKGKYRDFIGFLYQESKKIEPKVKKFDFSLIGPTNTALLMELINNDPIEKNAQSFRIFSASATISNNVLSKEIKHGIDHTCSNKPEDARIQCLLDERSIVRTIGQDRNLATALLWELEQRGVNRKNPIFKKDCKDQLILISEQDSLYARSLVEHFRSSLAKQCGGKEGLMTNFTYLRGLDGKLPGLDESNKKSQSEKNTQEQKNLLTPFDDASPEHAEGRNQFDYLRRLVDKIEQLGSADDNRDPIKAIGIIGIDVYDKLLILHALKDSFKHKIFFTTDLDARFLHKDQFTWARNLIVASNFDFALHPKLQGTTMPFRDSYQTSMYLATLLAVNPQATEDWVNIWMIQYSNNFQSRIILNNQFNALLVPQIFEIGRTQAIHLASPSNKFLDEWVTNPILKFTESKEIINSNCLVNNFIACNTIEPDRTKQIDWSIIYITSILLIFAAYISRGFFNRLLRNVFKPADTKQKQTRKHSLYVINEYVKSVFKTVATLLFAFLLLFLLLFSIYKDNYPTHADGEPFLWLERVSVWPNLVIRFLGVIVMILLFIYFFYHDRKQEIEAIENNFGLCKKTCLRSWPVAVRNGPFLNLPETKRTHIDHLWPEYKSAIQCKESKGYLWIFLVSAVSLGFTLYAFWGLGYLNFPARGIITFYSHYIIVTIQFFILWGLVFWVAYEAIACRQLIEGIEIDQANPNKTAWSSEMRKRQKIMTGLPVDKLNPYLHFLLITKLIKSINSIIYLPFILMLIIAIGRSDIFDNLGFSPALILVYISASAYLIAILYLLRKSAEKQCGMVLQYYEDYRMRLVATSFHQLSKIDNLLTEIRNVKQSTFVQILQRPALLAFLLPGGGIGLTSIIEYLYN